MKKKNHLPVIITSCVVGAALLGGGIFAAVKLLGNKEKSESENTDSGSFELEDLEHKTVDEIYNYINDEKIVRNKKKKKARKKKSKKEKIIEEDYQEEIEDSIVVQFKEDLSDKLIHAKNITKIKPNISEEWIKIISEYN